MRVLVAEDDDVIAGFVSQGLREAGYAVDVASTGPDALKKALEGGYDAAVMDVMLPGLDGLSVIEQLRARQRRTPVLILSARHTVDDRVKGLQAGGVAIKMRGWLDGLRGRPIPLRELGLQ